MLPPIHDMPNFLFFPFPFIISNLKTTSFVSILQEITIFLRYELRIVTHLTYCFNQLWSFFCMYVSNWGFLTLYHFPTLLDFYCDNFIHIWSGRSLTSLFFSSSSLFPFWEILMFNWSKNLFCHYVNTTEIYLSGDKQSRTSKQNVNLSICVLFHWVCWLLEFPFFSLKL